MTSPAIVWFRNDLRLADNPALLAAARGDRPVIPLFVWSPEEEGPWAPGAASRWWLHQSLAALARRLEQAGVRLILRQGSALSVLRDVVRETGAHAVYWNRRYEPLVIERDRRLKAALREDGIEADSFNAALLLEPWEVATKAGDPYQVFTPFWRACRERLPPAAPAVAPNALLPPVRWPHSVELAELQLEPRIDWAAGMRRAWAPGEDGARATLADFLADTVARYGERRDVPGEASTSRLSPYLHFGEIGPRQVWAAVQDEVFAARPEASAGADVFLREVGWREFAHHLLFHFPYTPEQPLRPAFRDFPWNDDRAALDAWRQGRTGYPIVDAGMRELWETGWMHNRVRMIVASFLVKDLRLPWQAGAEWFWDTLVDADLANNTLGWQWTAGCGADAAPYFRIFNPTTQAKKFDPDGHYIRRWVPELASLPAAASHMPSEAAARTLEDCGFDVARDYVEPIVDHAAARDRALAAFDRVKQAN